MKKDLSLIKSHLADMNEALPEMDKWMEAILKRYSNDEKLTKLISSSSNLLKSMTNATFDSLEAVDRLLDTVKQE